MGCCPVQWMAHLHTAGTILDYVKPGGGQSSASCCRAHARARTRYAHAYDGTFLKEERYAQHYGCDCLWSGGRKESQMHRDRASHVPVPVGGSSDFILP